MISNITQHAETKMKKALEAIKEEFAKIRSGRAHPSLLEHLAISYYGSNMPLNQVASVTVADARTLVIAPWDKQMVPVIEKAIMQSDLGITPTTAGQIIRISLPPLTEERRNSLIKVVKTEAENGRINIRGIRREANTEIKTLLKDKKISEDDEKRGEESVQKLTDKYIVEIDKLLETKEKDLSTV